MTMESNTKAQVNEIPKEGGVIERSTIEFPYADLDSSVDIVRGIHAVGGTACEYDQLAAHLGAEAKGGGFRMRVSGAKSFGLLTYERGGRVTLTELGRKIIDSQTEKSARADAFLKVPLFIRVFEDFKGRQLPPIAGLERALAGFGVGAKVVKNARQVLMRSAKQAGYFELNADRLTAPPSRISQGSEQQPKIDPPNTFGRNGGGGNGSGHHPFIEGLLQTLPPVGDDWTTEERMNWLNIASGVFKLLYKGGAEEIEIKIKQKQ